MIRNSNANPKGTHDFCFRVNCASQSTLITPRRTKQAYRICIVHSASTFDLRKELVCLLKDLISISYRSLFFISLYGGPSGWSSNVPTPPLWKELPPYPIPPPCSNLAVVFSCILVFDLHEHCMGCLHKRMHKNGVGC